MTTIPESSRDTARLAQSSCQAGMRRITRPFGHRAIDAAVSRVCGRRRARSLGRTSVAIVAAFGLWALPVHAQPPTCSWTDNPIVSGQTPIKAEHINEIRACLDAILANWPGTTDPSVRRPTIVAVVFNNSPVEGDTYRAGEEISVGLRFSGQVRITGRPRLALTIGNAVRQATTYQDLSPMDFRSFGYTVQADDLDTDGLGIAANALTLNGGSIRSLSGVDAVLDLGSHAVASDPTRRVDGRLGGPVAGSILDCPLDVAGNGYRVCHVDGYADDAEFVRSVLDPAAARLSRRFRPTTTPVDIYLFPEPDTVHGIAIQPARPWLTAARSIWTSIRWPVPPLRCAGLAATVSVCSSRTRRISARCSCTNSRPRSFTTTPATRNGPAGSCRASSSTRASRRGARSGNLQPNASGGMIRSPAGAIPVATSCWSCRNRTGQVLCCYATLPTASTREPRSHPRECPWDAHRGHRR